MALLWRLRIGAAFRTPSPISVLIERPFLVDFLPVMTWLRHLPLSEPFIILPYGSDPVLCAPLIEGRFYSFPFNVHGIYSVFLQSSKSGLREHAICKVEFHGD